MIHYITIHFLIRNDYARRMMFPRYCSLSTTTYDDLRIKLSTAELQVLCADAEAHAGVGMSYPNLAMAYTRLARKAREQLRAAPENPEIGRDNKSAAAGD